MNIVVDSSRFSDMSPELTRLGILNPEGTYRSRFLLTLVLVIRLGKQYGIEIL